MLKELFIIYVTVYCLKLKRSISTTPTPDDDDDDWEEDDSTEIDDDGRIYKNPRNSPSTLCPRDEEQATLLVCILHKQVPAFYSFPFVTNPIKSFSSQL